jgi:hypothetical protein
LKSDDLSQPARGKALGFRHGFFWPVAREEQQSILEMFFGFLEISLSQGKTPQGKMAERKLGIDVQGPPKRTHGFFGQILFL